MERVLRCAAGRPLRVMRLGTGRPWAGDGWCVSASRTGGWAAGLAVRAGCCGVDIERVRPVRHAGRIAACHFHPEERRLLCRASVQGGWRLFAVLWTRREALLKCLGTGLAVDAAGISTFAEGPFRVESHLVERADETLALSVCLPADAPRCRLRVC